MEGNVMKTQFISVFFVLCAAVAACSDSSESGKTKKTLWQDQVDSLHTAQDVGKLVNEAVEARARKPQE
jgi:ABC-type Fe3+-citrate transport system substrate-binding protein